MQQNTHYFLTNSVKSVLVKMHIHDELTKYDKAVNTKFDNNAVSSLKCHHYR